VSQFRDTLFTLRGRVANARPGLSPDFIDNALRDRLRQIQDDRTFWADLLTPGILSIPAPYGPGYTVPNGTGGSISMTTGSNAVTGTASFWPVADVVNTNIPAGVPEFGYVEVTPASMAGITFTSRLYVDAAGTPETVAVVQVNRTSFVAKFESLHNPGCTVTQSSLANQQLRVGQSYPIFTVAAVTYLDPGGSGNGTLHLTLPWGGPAYSGNYLIQLIYVTLAPDMKALIAVKDEQTGYPVRLHVSLMEANHTDPQRTISTGNPWFSLVDIGADDQGNMSHELWPAPYNQRQFSFYYWRQWPDMVKDTDQPPPFINPSILFFGAMADAKMHRTGKDDPYYDPQGAQHWGARFDQALQQAKNSDEAKVLQALSQPWFKFGPAGSYDTWQLNDPAFGSLWSGGYGPF
jgi:hypothetical protein